MKKCELLAPAGDMDCLRQAVYNGADAVYLSAQSYGARKFAKNFTNDELIEAIKFCHLYGVRIYVTMNTLIHDSEVEEFINQVRFLHQNGVDAIIMQDFGMICLIREMFPNLEIHASTQANNSSIDTCRLFYEMGVKRVVFSRELSVDEIDAIDIPIEKEAFIHGALCVSYSGCCLMSSMLGGRSGNRGECAGCCRLPYTLLQNGKSISNTQYLLSMKELNTSSEFQRLLNSSIYSFKIEGRMKGPLYVGFITRFYRKIIDGDSISLDEETKKLKTIFNREFTVGHLFGVSNGNLINSKSPNHVGLSIGTAECCGNKIKLILNKGEVLHQNDAIRFSKQQTGMYVNYLYDFKGKLCNQAENICFVDNKIDFKGKDNLAKTQDCTLDKEYIIERKLKKINVSFEVTAYKKEKLVISLSDGIYTVSQDGNIVESAVDAPITRDTIERQLSKLGETPFAASSISIEMDSNIFISISEINNMRRNLVNQLIQLRENKMVDFVENDVSFEKSEEKNEQNQFLKKSCIVYTEEQLLTCLDLPFDRIYVVSKALYEKYYQYDSVVFYLERCAYSYQNVFANQYYVQDYFNYHANCKCFGGYGLNITNIYSAYYAKKLGLRCIGLSVELNDIEIQKLISLFHDKFGDCDFEVLRYGRVENMIINSNILGLKTTINEYEIMDSKRRVFPVYFDGKNTHIYHCDIIQKELLNCWNLYDFYGISCNQIKQLSR